ncbi:4-fold beta flower protein [Pseudobdellovibrio sp. HCB154]|uniref:4-fold beta flower protein n=1 Tax=Pseudobdellovibrio sp. HCB154 TaxID=3386277 RepID=UPI0039171424
MSVRYIFNTRGEYVAFIQNKNLFSPDGKWLGFLPQGNLVFNKDGTFLGEVSSDDRILRNKTVNYQKMMTPFAPFTPFTPFRPFQRLRTSSPPYPYVDVFENKEGFSPTESTKDFSYLEGCTIVAPNNAYLGKITTNKFDQESILNKFSPYGNRYSQQSIFNEYCPYGGNYGQFSPLNKYSTTPPAIYRAGQFVAHLTVNPYVAGDKIDPNEFYKWIQSM